jgi:hypothetical protein
LIHINSLIYSITKSKELEINSKKYLSNEHLLDRKNFDILVKSLGNNFVSKKEFNLKINQIENRIEKVEENKSGYVLGTMVISLISLSIWRKILNFKKKY